MLFRSARAATDVAEQLVGFASTITAQQTGRLTPGRVAVGAVREAPQMLRRQWVTDQQRSGSNRGLMGALGLDHLLEPGEAVQPSALSPLGAPTL